jgi:Glycosyl hydrolases family 28
MKTIITLLLAIVLVSSITFSQVIFYNITNFGADSENKINTPAIQKTIDSCSSAGGGIVYVPAGNFVTGTIRLRSNITLFLENGAKLIGSANLEDYYIDSVRVGLIFTKNCRDIKITGTGIIDGNGDQFNYTTERKKFLPPESRLATRQKEKYCPDDAGIEDGPIEPHKDRPYQMLIFSNCKNVTVENVTLKDSPFWTLHLADCDHALITNLRIHNNVLVANSDGIDCTSCSNVMISNCEIIGGDDAIVLNSYSVHFDLPGFQNLKRPSENIVVSNCVLMSRSSGIRIGGIDHNYMKNYSFSNIIIYNSNRGIGIFTGIEGGIENCSFSDITIETRLHTGDWWGKAEPIHIQSVPTTKGRKAGIIKDIRFRNIKAVGESGIILYGYETGSISNVSFDGLDFYIKNSPLQKSYGGNFDLRPSAFQELSLFSHDIAGFFMKNVEDITIRNSKLSYDEKMEDFFRFGIWAEDFLNLTIDGLEGTPPNYTKDVFFYLERGENFSCQNSSINTPKKSFMVKKDVSGKILLTNNRFRE